MKAIGEWIVAAVVTFVLGATVAIALYILGATVLMIVRSL